MKSIAQADRQFGGRVCVVRLCARRIVRAGIWEHQRNGDRLKRRSESPALKSLRPRLVREFRQKTTTGSEGNIRLSHSVAFGLQHRATRAGFEAYTQNGVEVRADAAVTVNIALKPGKHIRDGHGKRRQRSDRRHDRHACRRSSAPRK